MYRDLNNIPVIVIEVSPSPDGFKV